MRNVVKKLRKEAGLRQEDMANKLGVSRQTIIAIENDKYNPTLELAMKIAKLMDAYFIDLYKQYPVVICGQRVILTNGELAEALSSLPEKRGKSFTFTFSGITHNRKSGKCTDVAGVRPGIKSAGLYSS